MDPAIMKLQKAEVRLWWGGGGKVRACRCRSGEDDRLHTCSGAELFSESIAMDNKSAHAHEK